MPYGFRNQWLCVVYGLLGINRGNVWVAGVYVPKDHFAESPRIHMLKQISEPDISREIATGIIQQLLSKLRICQVDVRVEVFEHDER